MNLDLVARLRRIADDLAGIVDHAETADHSQIADLSSGDPTKLAQRVVEQFVAAVEDGNLVAIGALVHPNVVHVVSGRSRAAGIHEGIDGLHHAFNITPRRGATDLRSRLTRLLADADEVVTFHEVSGRLDGTPFAFETSLRYIIDNGQIARIIEYSADQHRSDELFA